MAEKRSAEEQLPLNGSKAAKIVAESSSIADHDIESQDLVKQSHIPPPTSKDTVQLKAPIYNPTYAGMPFDIHCIFHEYYSAAITEYKEAAKNHKACRVVENGSRFFCGCDPSVLESYLNRKLCANAEQYQNLTDELKKIHVCRKGCRCCYGMNRQPWVFNYGDLARLRRLSSLAKEFDFDLCSTFSVSTSIGYVHEFMDTVDSFLSSGAPERSAGTHIGFWFNHWYEQSESTLNRHPTDHTTNCGFLTWDYRTFKIEYNIPESGYDGLRKVEVTYEQDEPRDCTYHRDYYGPGQEPNFTFTVTGNLLRFDWNLLNLIENESEDEDEDDYEE